MQRMVYLALCLALGASCEARGLGSIAEVTIIDRESGVVLTPYFYRGEYWVAGRPGARYAIEIRNRLAERLLAVTSVDGVNVVSGETAAWGQSGYVFDALQGYQITGWRKTDTEVAAFTFTDSPNSYAARTGRPANVGVIGVALFRERRPPSVYAPPPTDSAGRATHQAVPSPEERLFESSPKLGTGHGEREYSYVAHTEFLRMQTQPNELMRIRYDSLENLFAMGIIRRPHPGRPVTDPFPASPQGQYVPDPPG
jgi:hypothetical protein